MLVAKPDGFGLLEYPMARNTTTSVSTSVTSDRKYTVEKTAYSIRFMIVIAIAAAKPTFRSAKEIIKESLSARSILKARLAAQPTIIAPTASKILALAANFHSDLS